MTAAKPTKRSNRKDELEQAFERLYELLPPRVSRALIWLHAPERRWVRIPLGALFIVASFFWFLPVVGLEFLPIGLLLIAQDVPFLRKPMGHLMLALLDGFDKLKRWWKERHVKAD
jgi:hypothetical protein